LPVDFAEHIVRAASASRRSAADLPAEALRIDERSSASRAIDERVATAQPSANLNVTNLQISPICGWRFRRFGGGDQRKCPMVVIDGGGF
jgi:hypothetical protein